MFQFTSIMIEIALSRIGVLTSFNLSQITLYSHYSSLCQPDRSTAEYFHNYSSTHTLTPFFHNSEECFDFDRMTRSVVGGQLWSILYILQFSQATDFNFIVFQWKMKTEVHDYNILCKSVKPFQLYGGKCHIIITKM